MYNLIRILFCLLFVSTGVGCGVFLPERGEAGTPCESDENCQDGLRCHLEFCCQPDCDRHDCGTDGCGGSCGTCLDGKVCAGNKCICAAHDHFRCHQEDLWWFDSCGNPEEIKNECPYGCEADGCLEPCTADEDCDDEVTCTTDTCNEGLGICSYTPDNTICDNGEFCDGVEVCDETQDCQAGSNPCPSPLECDEDSDACTGCQADADCDDGFECTTEICNVESTFCVYTPDNATCDDGVLCNGMETCQEGSGCQIGTPPDCSDSVDCTDDSCDENSDTCQHVPNDANCDNGIYCDGVEVCDPESGCQQGTVLCQAPLECDENNDMCTGCLSDADCDDLIDCTTDTCNTGDATCINIPDDVVCDDGVLCNGLETCQVGIGCRNGTLPDCSDSVDCTADSCDEINDVCQNVPNDANCDNGHYCDGVEVCDHLLGCQAGNDPCADPLGCDESDDVCTGCLSDADCDDLIDCTVDTCNTGEATCLFTPDDAYCDNGNFCDGLVTCEVDVGCVAAGQFCHGLGCDEELDICEGSSWGGGISDCNGYSLYPVLALDGNDNPVVAYTIWSDENGPVNEIYLKAFDGSTWVEVGTGSASGGGISESDIGAYGASLAFDDDGYPVVAWTIHTAKHLKQSNPFGVNDPAVRNPGVIYMKRYDGSSWVEVSPGSASGTGISGPSEKSRGPSLALDVNGYPVVAWTEDQWHVYIKRFNGSSWEEVGEGSASGRGISDSDGRSKSPQLALDIDDNPVVVWHDSDSGNYEIYIKRYNGSSWVEVGTDSASGQGISVDEDDFHGGYPSLALDASGKPVVAWESVQDGGATREIFVKRFDGSSWVELGAGSATGGGISSSGNTESASLGLDDAGNPVVAWRSYLTGSTADIYVKRYNGSTWVEVGAGSASGGGISNNTSSSENPILVLDGAGYPVVTWWDLSSGDYEIYIKRFNGSAWVDIPDL